MELEAALLRAYAKTNQNVIPRSQREPNFLGSVQYKEDFVKEFMVSFANRRAALEAEVARGEHQNYGMIVDKIQQMAESKLRNSLTRELLNRRDFDHQALRRMIEEMKNDVRALFY